MNLPGLMGDSHCAPHILRRVSIHRELPNIELHVASANYNSSIVVDIGILIG